MLYIFPVSLSDSHLIDPLYSAFKTVGGLKGKRCIVTGDQSARDSVDWMVDRLTHLDALVESHVFPFVCGEGWPKACNRYFVSSAVIAAKQEQPFFYFELDNTPVKKGWSDKLEGEYMAGLANGKPFMGRMSKYLENRNGQWKENGNVMNGSAVYPAKYITESVLAREVGRIAIPWDVYMRWEMVPHCKDASEFVLFNWKSTNYRWENGQLVCDVTDRPSDIVHNGKSDPVTENTFIVHGCKDGSLAKLVAAGQVDAPPASHIDVPVAESPRETFGADLGAEEPKKEPFFSASNVNGGVFPSGMGEVVVKEPKNDTLTELAKPTAPAKKYTRGKRAKRRRKMTITDEDRARRAIRARQMAANRVKAKK